MKNFIKILTPLIYFSSISCIYAQEICNTFFASEKGTKIEMANYDKKDKLVNKNKYEIVDSKPIAGGREFIIQTEIIDANDKLISKVEQNAKCINGDYVTDVRVANPEMMQKDANVKVTIDGDKLFYPSNLSVGEKLKDASVTLKTEMGGMTIMNMTINITERKIEAYETIETPAGKFDCAKITYKMNMKFMGNRTYNSVEYLAKGIGIVKSEQFDDKGKKQSSMIITKISK